jgi:hypothetical protein
MLTRIGEFLLTPQAKFANITEPDDEEKEGGNEGEAAEGERSCFRAYYNVDGGFGALTFTSDLTGLPIFQLVPVNATSLAHPKRLPYLRLQSPPAPPTAPAARRSVTVPLPHSQSLAEYNLADEENFRPACSLGSCTGGGTVSGRGWEGKWEYVEGGATVNAADRRSTSVSTPQPLVGDSLSNSRVEPVALGARKVSEQARKSLLRP